MCAVDVLCFVEATDCNECYFSVGCRNWCLALYRFVGGSSKRKYFGEAVSWMVGFLPTLKQPVAGEFGLIQNGRDHWIIGDGAEGYLSERLTPDGRPVCSGVAPPSTAVGPFSGTTISDPL
jgi:hypothetical protein